MSEIRQHISTGEITTGSRPAERAPVGRRRGDASPTGAARRAESVLSAGKDCTRETLTPDERTDEKARHSRRAEWGYWRGCRKGC